MWKKWKIFCQINSFVINIIFRKCVAFTKLLSKRLNFRNFHNFHWVPSYTLCAVELKNHSVKKRKITYILHISQRKTKKNYSWNQLFSNYFVKLLLSRNFCHKSLKENFHNFKVGITLWILWNFCITTFWKISVKTISLVKSLLYNWFHEIIFKWYKKFVNSTVQCGRRSNEERFLQIIRENKITYVICTFNFTEI